MTNGMIVMFEEMMIWKIICWQGTQLTDISTSHQMLKIIISIPALISNRILLRYNKHLSVILRVVMLVNIFSKALLIKKEAGPTLWFSKIFPLLILFRKVSLLFIFVFVTYLAIYEIMIIFYRWLSKYHTINSKPMWRIFIFQA